MNAKEFPDKVIDTLLFREGTEEEADGSIQPILTTGSIVWGVILRSAIVVFLSLILISQLSLQEYWWLAAFALWLIAAYPGWRQYQKFNYRMKKFQEETLCGSCVHFDPSSQLCKIYDEHPTKNFIPCEGTDWEPIHRDLEN